MPPREAELALVRRQLLALSGQVRVLPVARDEEYEIRQHLAGLVGALGKVVTPGRGEHLSGSTLVRINNAAALLAALVDTFGHRPGHPP
jgi:hypothetical protein